MRFQPGVRRFAAVLLAASLFALPAGAKVKQIGFAAKPSVLFAPESGSIQIHSIVDAGAGFVLAFSWASVGEPAKVYVGKIGQDGQAMGTPIAIMDATPGFPIRLVWHGGRLYALGIGKDGLVSTEVGDGGVLGAQKVLVARKAGKEFSLIAYAWDSKAVAVLLKGELSAANPTPQVSFWRLSLEGVPVGKSQVVDLGGPRDFEKGWSHSMRASLAWNAEAYLATVGVDSTYRVMESEYYYETSIYTVEITAQGQAGTPLLATSETKTCLFVLGEKQCRDMAVTHQKGGYEGVLLAALMKAGPLVMALAKPKGLAIAEVGQGAKSGKAAKTAFGKIAQGAAVTWSLENPARESIAVGEGGRFAMFVSPWEVQVGGGVLSPAGGTKGVVWVAVSIDAKTKGSRSTLYFAPLGTGPGKPVAASKKEPVEPEDTAVKCKDGKDNDGDGLTDCADQDCSLFVFCVA